MSYTNGTAVHVVRLDVIPFSGTPAGPYNDYAYLGSAFKPTVSEPGIVATFQNFGLVWQHYYSPDWTLTLESAWQRLGESSSMVAVTPTITPVTGAAPRLPIPRPTLRRIFTVTSQMGRYQRVWLADVATNKIAAAVYVTPGSGGFDSRDQRMIDYLSANNSAVVVFDGYPVQPAAKVRIHFDIEPSGTSTGGTGEVLPSWLGQIIPIPGNITPDVGVDDAHQLCGVAVAMSHYLIETYNNIAKWVAGFETLILSYLLQFVIDAVIEALSVGLATELLWLEQPLVNSFAKWLITTSLGTDWPQLTLPQDDTLERTCYCALQPTAGSVNITNGILSDWQSRIGSAGGFAGDPQVFALQSIIGFVGVAKWQQLALNATPSSACDMVVC